MTRGLFIAIEGIDGVGKSTVAQRLAVTFNAEVLRPVSAEDRTKSDDLCRTTSDPRAIHAFSLDAISRQAEIVKSKLHDGTNVVMDRYIYSSLCYFRAFCLNKGFPISPIGKDRSFPLPDIGILLELEEGVNISERILNQGRKYDVSDDLVLNNQNFTSDLIYASHRYRDSGFLKTFGSNDISGMEQHISSLTVGEIRSLKLTQDMYYCQS